MRREGNRVVAMEHRRFVQSWRARRLAVDVDRLTLRAADSPNLPKRYRALHIFFTLVWILAIAAAFAVIYFYAAWAGALIFLIVPRTLFLLARAATRKMLIEHAVEDPDFYAMAIEKGFFRMRRSPVWSVEEEQSARH
jgi:hypothetical protein